MSSAHDDTRPPAGLEPAAVLLAPGFQIYELLVVLVVLTLASTFAIPPFLDWSRSLRVELAANELSSALRLARSQAVRYSANVGVKFRTDARGRVAYRLYRDADGDGVRTADINGGIDLPMGPWIELLHLGQHVRFGFPPGPAPRDPSDPSRRLNRLHDPVRFNRSDLASFNHLGGSTPGSAYLTDGRACLVVVRLFGRTGKVKQMRYDQQSESWE